MKLLEIYKILLLESERENIEFPNDSLMVTAERDQKRLLFIPVHHSSVTDKIQSYGNVLKQNFMVISTKEIEDGAFEFVFDPREDFEAVIDFVKAQSVREQ